MVWRSCLKYIQVSFLFVTLPALAAVPADYSITLTLEVLKPISEVSSINTDAQTVKIVNENEKTVTLEIQVRPLTDQLTHLQPNPNWRTEYSQTPSLQEYLRPRLTTNWDQSMRAELVQALVEDGIYPDQLNDVDLVKKVSSWIQRRFKYVDHFVSFDVDFSTGTAVVDPALRPHFDFEKVKNGFSTDEEALAKGVFGKSMFQARLRGNCTMTATLQATVLKALGIPTRLVGTVLPLDPNDADQIQLFSEQVHHNEIRRQVTDKMKTSKGWVNHTFNEVFIGGRWIRLNYNILGQPPIWSTMGMMVQIFRFADWGDSKLTSWAKQAYGIERDINPSSPNVYRLLKIKDDPSMLTASNNPLLPQSKIKAIKLLKFHGVDHVDGLPSLIADVIKSTDKRGLAFFVEVDLGGAEFDYKEIRLFGQSVSDKFVLSAPGYPNVEMYYQGSWSGLGSDGLLFQAQENMVSGVQYTLKVVKDSGEFHWEVANDIKLARPLAGSQSLNMESSCSALLH